MLWLYVAHQHKLSIQNVRFKQTLIGQKLMVCQMLKSNCRLQLLTNCQQTFLNVLATRLQLTPTHTSSRQLTPVHASTTGQHNRPTPPNTPKTPSTLSTPNTKTPRHQDLKTPRSKHPHQNLESSSGSIFFSTTQAQQPKLNNLAIAAMYQTPQQERRSTPKTPKTPTKSAPATRPDLRVITFGFAGFDAAWTTDQGQGNFGSGALALPTASEDGTTTCGASAAFTSAASTPAVSTPVQPRQRPKQPRAPVKPRFCRLNSLNSLNM